MALACAGPARRETPAGAGDLGEPSAGRSPLAGLGPVELVRDGFHFVEGVRWYPPAGKLLVSDAFGDVIYALAPPARFEPFRQPSNFANCLDVDGQGRLVAAETGGRDNRGGGVSRLESGGWASAIRDARGLTVAGPNDIVALPDGSLVYSDIGNTRRLYRIDASGALLYALEANDAGLNGLALSPDKRILYVGYGRVPVVRAFDVQPDGRLTGMRDFARTAPTPDGMCVDVAGNLYVGTREGLQVFDRAGRSWV